MPKFSRNEINIAKIMLRFNKNKLQKLKTHNKSRLIIKLKKTK
jgi:hypothetical protein